MDALSKQHLRTQSYKINEVKGTLTREMLPLVFFIKIHPSTPSFIPYGKAVLKISSNSLKYLNFQSIKQCGPPAGSAFFFKLEQIQILDFIVLV
jgi:hypothetical protein